MGVLILIPTPVPRDTHISPTTSCNIKVLPNHACTRNDRGSLTIKSIIFSLFYMTLLIERELSRTQLKSMVVMVGHVVEEV